MMKRKSALTAAVILGGAVGLAGNPAWSQSRPSERPGVPSDQNRTPTRPGDEQSLPPRSSEPRGATELSSQDVKLVQQALETKGHKAGSSGVMDDKTRDAIRAFQKEQGLSVTGTIDEKTANALGLSMNRGPSSGSGSTAPGSTSPGSTNRPGMPGSGSGSPGGSSVK